MPGRAGPCEPAALWPTTIQPHSLDTSTPPTLFLVHGKEAGTLLPTTRQKVHQRPWSRCGTTEDLTRKNHKAESMHKEGTRGGNITVAGEDMEGQGGQ